MLLSIATTEPSCRGTGIGARDVHFPTGLGTPEVSWGHDSDTGALRDELASNNVENMLRRSILAVCSISERERLVPSCRWRSRKKKQVI